MQPVLVCGVDDSVGARNALAEAARVAERLRVRLLVVHVAEIETRMPDALGRHADRAEDVALTEGRRLLDRVSDGLPRGRDREDSVAFGKPGETLMRIARDERARLIVVGSRGRRGLTAALLGSESAQVAAGAPCPVLIVPPRSGDRDPEGGDDAGARPILCGVDDSDHSLRAARAAADLAAQLGARLVLAHVCRMSVPPGGQRSATTPRGVPIDFDALLEAEKRAAVRLLHRAQEAAADACETEIRLEAGDPAERLERLSALISAELIVVGTRGHGSLRSALLGSVSSRLSASASRPVMIVPPGVDAEAAAARAGETLHAPG